MNRAEALRVIAGLERAAPRAAVRAPAPRIMSRREVLATIARIEADERFRTGRRFGQAEDYSVARRQALARLYGAPMKRGEWAKW